MPGLSRVPDDAQACETRAPSRPSDSAASRPSTSRTCPAPSRARAGSSTSCTRQTWALPAPAGLEHWPHPAPPPSPDPWPTLPEIERQHPDGRTSGAGVDRPRTPPGRDHDPASRRQRCGARLSSLDSHPAPEVIPPPVPEAPRACPLPARAVLGVVDQLHVAVHDHRTRHAGPDPALSGEHR